MNIFDKPFKNVNLLEKAIDASWLKHEIISSNIVNVNTPKYKRSIVQFESILQDELNHFSVQGKRTHLKHIPLGHRSIEDIVPVVIKDSSTKYRKDGNNVDIDVEMSDLAKNTINSNVLSQMISNNIRKLKLVVRDGR